MPFKLELDKKGFNMALKPYQINALQYLWTVPETGGSSKDVFEAVNEMLGEETISRASIINSLNALVDDGVLGYREITGKGGHRRIYKTLYDESGFKEYLAKTAITKLLAEFPEETRKALA